MYHMSSEGSGDIEMLGDPSYHAQGGFMKPAGEHHEVYIVYKPNSQAQVAGNSVSVHV